MLIKLGEYTSVAATDIIPTEDILSDPEIEERFKVFAANLKVIAPKASDFLYFTAVMMHAAEASILDKDGNIKKDASGNNVEVKWEKTPGGGIKWVCSDAGIMPYKNHNSDIFPELELITAHKKWIGKPLCVDHKSNEVDAVRGCIVDTYYDKAKKRVIALCALDKVSYPDLAHKVATGCSTNVSMGTGVSTAVCTDCYTAATTEKEFCHHMRNKSCYGEINLGLSPIELSIVVNGADPGAKIKQVIARDLSKAADHIAEYLDNKVSSKDGATHDELLAIQKDLEQINLKVAKLVNSSAAQEDNSKKDKDSNNVNYGTTGSTTASKGLTQKEDAENNVALDINVPEAVPTWAADKSLNELMTKVNQIQIKLDNFIKNSEDKMAQNNKTAYYQGTEEPAPGKVKYPNTDDYKKIRDTQDKQMVGQTPFPGTGPVEGMHPGVQSAGESEESRKKRLQRLAEISRRTAIRTAALEKAKAKAASNKQGWYQGTEEPKPGQVQYPNETDYKKIRDTQDKQMVGQPPFPDVGPVDGLHPSPASADEKDELKRKQMLSRAKLRAQFAKVADDNGKIDLGKSNWKFFSGDNLILTATVEEIAGSNPTEAVYDAIATEQFALNALKKIRAEGFEKTLSSLKKSGQAGLAVTEGAPGIPGDAMPPPVDMPGGEMDKLDEPEGAGAPEDQIANLAAEIGDSLDKARELASQIEEAAGGLDVEIEGMGDIEAASEVDFKNQKTADVNKLQGMRKYLNRELHSALLESEATVKAHISELETTASILNNKDRVNSFNDEERKYLVSLASEGLEAVKSTFSDVDRLKAAFLRYAQGTNKLEKRAQMAKEGQDYDGEDVVTVKEDTIKAMPPEVSSGAGAAKPQPVPADYDEGDPLIGVDGKSVIDDTANADIGDVMVDVDPENPPAGTKLQLTNASVDLSTKEGRAEYRAKLAQKAIDGIGYGDMVGRAHPKGGTTPPNIDKAQQGLDLVETVLEDKTKIMEKVRKSPAVKRQAERIQSLVVSGQLRPDQVDGLVAEGVDADAVKYWKMMWNEAKDKESKQWAADLVKDVSQKKRASDMEAEKARIARAYDLAYKMRDTDLCEATSLDAQVKEILSWNDEAFNSTKRIVEKRAAKKVSVPRVGMLDSGDVMLPFKRAEASVEPDVNIKEVFDQHFAGKRF